MSVRSALLVAAAVLGATGCPGGSARLDLPPDVRYGVDPCDRCGMIVSDERFASAYVSSAGATRRFDDLGCMTSFLVEQPEAVGVVWVHDQESRAWLRAPQATYVRTTSIKTPMGTGIVAVASATRAQVLAERERGQLLDFDALRALGATIWER